MLRVYSAERGRAKGPGPGQLLPPRTAHARLPAGARHLAAAVLSLVPQRNIIAGPRLAGDLTRASPCRGCSVNSEVSRAIEVFQAQPNAAMCTRAAPATQLDPPAAAARPAGAHLSTGAACMMSLELREEASAAGSEGSMDSSSCDDRDHEEAADSPTALAQVHTKRLAATSTSPRPSAAAR